MLNLEVALGSFWQLARHWRQGETARLELTCEDGNLQLQLSSKLGHPDKIHFPDPPPTLPPNIKKKSPSQLRRQERRRKEAVTKADQALTSTETVITLSDTSSIDPKEAPENSIVAEKSSLSTISFKCDQCNFVSASEKGVKMHTRLKHRISQLDGQEDLEESESEKTPCPLCPVWVYCKCGQCEECDNIATEEGLNVHILNDHEPTDVINHFQADWIRERKHFIQRNMNDAQDRYHSQKWDSALDL